MANKFLLNHFLLSWEIAVQNCKLILDGLIDLEQKKSFVSSFQNAIELGCKQIMIDECDYSIIDYSYKRMSAADTKIYLNSTDLNDYFSKLNIEKLNKLYSIEFNEIIEKFSKKINAEENVQIKDKLNILKKLRNNETHFYISETDYLTFDDFKQLCYLMDFFFKYFVSKNLISFGFGKPSPDWKCNLDYFDITEYNFVSFDDFVKNSKTTASIVDNYSKFNPKDTSEGTHYQLHEEDDDYGIAYTIYEEKELPYVINFNMNFNEFYRRYVILKSMDIIHVEIFADENSICDEIDENGEVINQYYGYVSIVITNNL